ncbi:MAG: neuraminidase-like domain-containing protein, partial [Cyclobacteriaceae bacterium]
MGFDTSNMQTQPIDWLVRVFKTFEILSVLKAPVSILTEILPVTVQAEPEIIKRDLEIPASDKIRIAVKSSYTESTWEKTGEDIRNDLRKKQRDALVSYVKHTNGFNSDEDLFNYYLLDTQIEPCFKTSRIKLAISTVQTLVQRINMGLENNLSFAVEDRNEWKWRKNYRVWEAARKIFLYPENWIEAELRDNKSPFFEELEEALLQDEVSASTVESAFTNYLTKVDEVGRLEISAGHMDEEQQTYHVFARTRNRPHIYYHRTWNRSTSWTAWKKLELEIEGNHLMPTIFNRRLYLFWPSFEVKPVPITSQNVGTDVAPSLPDTFTEIKMSYSEYKNDNWEAKRVSSTAVTTRIPGDEFNFFFKTAVKNNELSIDSYVASTIAGNRRHLGTFMMDNCNGKLEVSTRAGAPAPANFTVSGTRRYGMKLIQISGEDFEITEQIKAGSDNQSGDGTKSRRSFLADRRTIFSQTPSAFRSTYPLNGAELLSANPFFYEDGQRTFFITPSEKTFEKEFLEQLPPLTVANIVDVSVQEEVPTEDDLPTELPGDLDGFVRDDFGKDDRVIAGDS